MYVDTVIIFVAAKLIIIYEGVCSYHLVYKQSEIIDR